MQRVIHIRKSSMVCGEDDSLDQGQAEQGDKGFYITPMGESAAAASSNHETRGWSRASMHQFGYELIPAGLRTE